MTEAKPKAAIVTGAARGIGAAIAERLAQDGFRVLVNYAADVEAANALVARIKKAGGVAAPFKGSVADPAVVKAMFDETERAFGGVDVLVNNAGVMELAPLAETSDAMFDHTIAVNLKGVFNGLREAGLRLRDNGRVINLSTSVVGTYFATYGAYAASKAGVEALNRVFAKEIGGRGITVNAVAPGPVETKLFMTGKTEAQLEAAKARSPLMRLGQPDDIASVISFLAGPDGAWVNGQVLRANGGAI